MRVCVCVWGGGSLAGQAVAQVEETTLASGSIATDAPATDAAVKLDVPTAWMLPPPPPSPVGLPAGLGPAARPGAPDVLLPESAAAAAALPPGVVLHAEPAQHVLRQSVAVMLAQAGFGGKGAAPRMERVGRELEELTAASFPSPLRPAALHRRTPTTAQHPDRGAGQCLCDVWARLARVSRHVWASNAPCGACQAWAVGRARPHRREPDRRAGGRARRGSGGRRSCSCTRWRRLASSRSRGWRRR